MRLARAARQAFEPIVPFRRQATDGSLSFSCRPISGFERLAAWIGDEPVAVRHLDRGERLRQAIASAGTTSVEMKDVGGHRVDIRIAEGLRRVLRHRSADVVE